MKIPAVFLGLTVVIGALQAQPAPASAPAAPATVVKPATKPDAKAKAADPKAKKEAAMGTVKGTEIKRANGTYLGLEVVSNNFVLTFYNAKKKPMAMDVTRAAARWPNVRGPGDNRTVLNGSGTTLVGSKPVLPPYNFNVYLTLLQGDGEDAKAVETLVVQFRG